MSKPSDLKSLWTAKLQMAIANNLLYNTPMLVKGNPGIGKTEIITAIGAMLGIRVRNVRLSQFCDNAELSGLLKIVQKDGIDVTTHIRPDWLPMPEEGFNILFLDEFNRATHDIRQGIFQLLTDWEIGSHKISPKTFIFVAMNYDNEYNHVETLDTATLSRFVHYDMDVSTEDWLNWAKEEKIHQDIISFITASPEMLYPSIGNKDRIDDPFACPRTWAYLSKNMVLAESTKGIPQSLINLEIVGCLGNIVGVSFITWRNQQEKPLTLEDILTRPDLVDRQLFDADDNFVYDGSKFQTTLANITGGLVKRLEMDEALNKCSVEERRFCLRAISKDEVRNLFQFMRSLPPELAATVINAMYDIQNKDSNRISFYWQSVYAFMENSVNKADLKEFTEAVSRKKQLR